MQKLVVLDYSTSSVNIYDNPDENKDTEDLLEDLGHNIDECSFMFCENLIIKFNEAH